MTTRKQSTTLGPDHIMPNLEEALAEVNVTTLFVKLAIGYAFVITAYYASWHIAVMLALMTSIVWLQYVIVFGVLCALLAGTVYAAAPVTNAIYDAGAFVGSKAKSLFASLGDFASSAKARFAPSTDTVH
jgi:hypothetical protein